MKDNNQMIKVEDGFFARLRNKIKDLFLKFKKVNKTENKLNAIQEKNNNGLSKQEIIILYEKIKNEEIDLEQLDVDDDTLYKVIELLNEEINIIHNKMKSTLEETKIHLYNLKMYTKEIEILNKKN